ncbi:tRNA (adenine(58)-N(1))-methyltransferase non-catalytic subunit TRM6 [Lethenteron reissneri]|uniref:tRNA (adenine(58)-N(1))-methyltransferase non-catalytic subunit TRM6 n=1 Tax=Lethenteron reissneri TaxID=7753 RepID=UPI002AB61FC4|nr:tRNA (adenine(58)-N(1))-methyltransferase non-catalytic subunit TRM6 [Lethenteron reissneri]
MQTDTTTVVIIGEGDRVVLKREDLLKAVRVERHRKVNFEKKWFFVDSLIGARYGTTFDITGGGDLQPLCASKVLKAEVAVSESGVDNRNIQSDGSAQKLTRDDISALKEQGLRGTEIVSQLVENSSTFKEKTEFSQEKYIKRKKKKYESHITVLKPNARLLATMYHSREPAKICHLRVDSLSQLLASGNVRASGKTIVVESCSGLVLGAVMERMGGHGTILNVHAGAMANTTATEHFGFPERFFARVFSVPLDRIGAIAQQCCDGAAASNTDAVAANNTAASNNAVAASNNAVVVSNTGAAANNTTVAASNNTATVVSAECTGLPEGCSDGCADDSGMDTEAPAAGNVEQPEQDSQQAELDSIAGEQAGKRQGDVRTESETGMANVKDLKSQKEVRQEERKRCADIGVAELARRDADGLIIACKFQPWPILEGLLDFVSPSRPFVVFCQHREPLLECYTNLKERGSTVSLHLTESWLRFYQVLPNRTHPLMSTSASGGYLLTGITVAPDAGSAAERPAAERPAAEKPTAERPVAEKPTVERPVAEKPTVERPVAEKPTVERPVAEKPTVEGLLVEKPTAEGPVAEKPTVEGLLVEKPTAERPAAEKPVAEGLLVKKPVAESSCSADGPVTEEPMAMQEPVTEKPTAAAEEREEEEGPKAKRAKTDGDRDS